MNAADVVERALEVARQRGARAQYCSSPNAELLYAAVKYVVDRAMNTKGELMTVPAAPIRRLFPHEYIRANCIVAWLGLEDCVFTRRQGKVILYLGCVREKLGII